MKVVLRRGSRGASNSKNVRGRGERGHDPEGEALESSKGLPLQILCEVQCRTQVISSHPFIIWIRNECIGIIPLTLPRCRRSNRFYLLPWSRGRNNNEMMRGKSGGTLFVCLNMAHLTTIRTFPLRSLLLAGDGSRAGRGARGASTSSIGGRCSGDTFGFFAGEASFAVTFEASKLDSESGVHNLLANHNRGCHVKESGIQIRRRRGLEDVL